MKAANKAVRMKDEEKGNRQLEELGCDHEKIQSLRMPDCFGHVGFAPFELSNNNANIRRIEERIRRLERQQEREPVHETTELYEFRMEDNRVQFIFDGKPSKEIRDILRRNAFKWSPSRNAWVRQASGNGIYASRIVKEALVRFQKENHAGTSNERRLM